MNRLAWYITLLTAAYAFWAFPRLPARIPIHFGPDGTPDGWGGPYSIFLPVVLGIVVQGMMAGAVKLSTVLPMNIPKGRDPDVEKAWALRFLSRVRVWVAALFLLILWNTVEVALGGRTDLHPVFYGYTIGGVVVILWVAIRRSWSKPEQV